MLTRDANSILIIVTTIFAGFNPHWDCSMTFTVHLADLALIRFAVWDEDPIGRDFIGQVTMPVRSLMPGKTLLPL